MQESEKIIIRPTHNQEELMAIFRLRYKNYLRKGYIPVNPARMLTDKWDDLPLTIQYIALRKHQIVGAVRLVPDSEDGIPMDSVFPEEIAGLRKQGRKIAEASMMIAASDAEKSCQSLWLRLCKSVWKIAEARRIDDLCIAVTLNHVAFYEKLLFQKMGNKRQYKTLNGIIAYAMRLCVSGVREKCKSDNNSRSGSLRRLILDP